MNSALWRSKATPLLSYCVSACQSREVPGAQAGKPDPSLPGTEYLPASLPECPPPGLPPLSPGWSPLLLQGRPCGSAGPHLASGPAVGLSSPALRECQRERWGTGVRGVGGPRGPVSTDSGLCPTAAGLGAVAVLGNPLCKQRTHFHLGCPRPASRAPDSRPKNIPGRVLIKHSGCSPGVKRRRGRGGLSPEAGRGRPAGNTCSHTCAHSRRRLSPLNPRTDTLGGVGPERRA